MLKNNSGQKWRVFAFNRTTNTPVTGDASNITAKISKDHGSLAAITDTNPTETEDGFYLFDLTQEETNANTLDIYPESSSSNVQVIGVPGTVYTTTDHTSTLSAIQSKTNLITTASVSVTSVITSSDGTTINIVQGDDYNSEESRSITWTSSSEDQWPDLTDSTVEFGLSGAGLTKICTVNSPTGTQSIEMELSNTETRIPAGTYQYDLQATLSNDRVITLVRGSFVVTKSYTN